MHHFGEGLVRTTSDFGTRCEPPTHPELLDWLARWFMDNGWSLKKLHRLIMTSAVYQQSSLAENNEVDPENKLLSRFNRQRLDLEALRDSVLFVSGELDFKAGGRGDAMFAEKYSKRRAVYGYIDREFVPGTMRVFDFPTPDMHSPQRSETTIPQQALFFMNGTFVMKQAKALATVSTNGTAGNMKFGTRSSASLPDDRERLREIYRRVYQREPSPRQMQLGLEFIRNAATASAEDVAETPKNPNALDWRYGYGEFDAKTKQLNKFETLPFFTGTAWQGGAAWPDPALGWLQLTATGGHAGNTLKQPVVRRWVSPVKGTVSISGKVSHERAPGHGIRAYILSSRHGVLGSWTLHNKSAEAKRDNIAVQPGDTLDFIVSIHSSLNHNDFLWSPVIRMVGDDAIKDPNGYAKEWSAEKDFAGNQTKELPPLDAWEKYAQVLLLSNEFVFVD